jgi:ATP-dependent Clp protease ATP-binding subunit ClpC
MFERFTDRARRAVVVAQDEARDLQHPLIQPAHLLLGLLKGEGLAGQALAQCGVTYEDTRARVVHTIRATPEAGSARKVPFSPQSKKALELSLREALRLGHNYIGTEHILLGLLRGSAGELSDVLNVGSAQIQLRVMELLSASHGPARSPALSEAMDQARQAAGPSVLTTGQVVTAILADENSQATRALTALGATAPSFRAALAKVPVEGTSDASGAAPPIEIRMGERTVRVHDGDLFSALKDLKSEEIRDALKRGLRPDEGRTGSEG